MPHFAGKPDLLESDFGPDVEMLPESPPTPLEIIVDTEVSVEVTNMAEFPPLHGLQAQQGNRKRLMSVAECSTSTGQTTLGYSRIQSVVSAADGMPEDWDPKLGAFMTDDPDAGEEGK